MQPKPSTFAVGILICVICLLLGACKSSASDINTSVTPNASNQVLSKVEGTLSGWQVCNY
ncbi:hypothetical protein [Bacteroides sp. 224]|uniref:hypothetical protein n=1 Tax=Bacteroides sp. 224 TaxID=2302936 RepID=UPI0013D05E09|nr:hypothetical protein [Bacteroides sp. 224]